MATKKPERKFFVILILGLLTAIGPFSIDMYLPAFPEIARGLHTDVAHVMLSLSSFFIGISAGQLIYGPLLERFGRKKPLYTGLLIYLLASVGCALSPSVNALIGFRLMQALGGCVGMVASRAIVRDLFETRETAKIFSTLMLVVAVSPIIAPTLGGYVTSELGWRAVFVVLMAVNLLILTGTFFFLPESKMPDPGFSLKPAAITRNFLGIIAHPVFYTYALTGAVSYAGLSAYVSGSPAVFMEMFHVGEKQFGWIFAFIAVGIIGSSQLNTLALRRYSSERIIKTACFSQTATGILFAFLSSAGWIDMYTAIALIFLFLCCQGFIFPNASALCLAPFGHNAGSASALMGAIQMGIGAGSSALVSLLQNGTAVPMSGVMAFGAGGALVIFLFGQRKSRRPTKELNQEGSIEMISKL